MKKIRLEFLGAFGLVIGLGGFLWAADLMEKKFNLDLKYYHRTARTENLNANDRLYILNRLREKYRKAEFDCTELYAEIDHWSGIRQKLKIPPAAEPPPAAEHPSFAALKGIDVSNSENQTAIEMEVPGLRQYREILVHDKNPKKKPVLILYLYNTKNLLKSAQHKIDLREGWVRQIQSRVVSAKPPTTRVAFSLRANASYELNLQEDRMMILITTPAVSMGMAATDPNLVEAAPEVVEEEPEINPASETSVSLASLALTASHSRMIQKGDVLRISVPLYESLAKTTAVDPNGRIYFPPAGSLDAAGFTPQQIEKELTGKLGDMLPEPKPKIEILNFDPQHALLIGAVKSPGVYALTQALGAYELIIQSSGFAPDADKGKALIYTGPKEARKQILFDLTRMQDSKGKPARDFPLKPGNVVEVPTGAEEIFVYGAVKHPGSYKWSQEMKFSEALRNAGGILPQVQVKDARLARDDQGKKLIQPVQWNHSEKRSEPDLAIEAGDLIFVEKKAGGSKWLTREVISWTSFFVSLGLVLALLV